jgi:chromosome segregation ATPase
LRSFLRAKLFLEPWQFSYGCIPSTLINSLSRLTFHTSCPVSRAHARLQTDLNALETERRVERRDRTALASRLRAAEAAATSAGDRLAALQGLLAARESELARTRGELAEAQAGRAALQAEERRLSAAVASLGGRVDTEVESLRAEVAGLKRAATAREALVTELTVRT